MRGLSFVYCRLNMFIEVPLFSETSPALKNSWLRACNLGSVFFKSLQIFQHSHTEKHLRATLSGLCENFN